MQIKRDAIRDRILKHNPVLAPDSKIGVWSSFCEKQQAVIEQPNGVIVKMIATTDAIDLDQEVVVASGAKADSYFFKNGSIFAHHDYEHCIGKRRTIDAVKSLSGVQTGWAVNVHIYDLEKSPYAKDMIVFAKEGTLACSIGFLGLDCGRPTPMEARTYKTSELEPDSIVRSWNWLELSLTLFPCNVVCQQVGFGVADGKEYQAELITKRAEYAVGMYRKGLISAASAKLFDLDRPAPKRLHVDLSTPRRIAATI